MKKRDLWFVFLIVFLPRCVCLFRAYPLIYASDETSAISIAALAAGYDWSNVVTKAGYYGIGYLFLFAPLFHIVKNPLYIYRIILLVSSMVVSASAPICYMILHKFIKVESRAIKVAISALCGALNFFSTPVMSTRNEEILYFLIWLIVYTLCNLLYYDAMPSKRKKNEIILLLLLGYSLTIHTRAICLVIGVLLFDVISRILMKKELIHKQSYCIIVAGYMVINCGLKWYQGTIWPQGTVNTSVISGVENTLSHVDFKNSNLYLNILRIVGGQVYTAVTVSGGLFIIAVFLIIFYILEDRYKEDEKGNYIFTIGGLFLFCTFFTIGGQSITWLSGVTNGMQKYGEGVFRDAYRAFTYLRYMGCYVSPFVMCATVLAVEERKLLKKASLYGMMAISILTVFWIKMILPYIGNRRMDLFSIFGGMREKEDITCQNYYRACLIFLAIFIIGLELIYFKKELLYVWLVILLLTIQKNYIFENLTLPREQRLYGEADAGYDLIQKMLDEKALKDIYVFSAWDNGHPIFYLYQFLNYSVNIMPELPQDLGSDMLLFSNKNLKGELGGNCYGAQLDENEYVYCIGEEYVRLIENCGITMQEWR